MSISSGSTKPYLIRALYDWCTDNQQTPYLAVWVDEHTRVPMQYVRDNEIVLSISQTACQNLKIDNDWIHLAARFGGVSHEIWIPVGNVISIFSKETGEGMGFEVEKMETELSLLDDQNKNDIHPSSETSEESKDDENNSGDSESSSMPSHLRILK